MLALIPVMGPVFAVIALCVVAIFPIPAAIAGPVWVILWTLFAF